MLESCSHLRVPTKAGASVSLDIRMLSPQQERRGDKSTLEFQVCPFCLESSLRQRVRGRVPRWGCRGWKLPVCQQVDGAEVLFPFLTPRGLAGRTQTISGAQTPRKAFRQATLKQLTEPGMFLTGKEKKYTEHPARSLHPHLRKTQSVIPGNSPNKIHTFWFCLCLCSSSSKTGENPSLTGSLAWERNERGTEQLLANVST